MSLLGDIVTGAAGMVGFALGGPVGAGLLGGVVGGVVAGFESDWDWDEVGKGALVGGAGGLLGGAVGWGVKGALFAKGAASQTNFLATTATGRFGFAAQFFKTTVPNALGAGKVSPLRFYSGLFGAAFTPGMIKPIVDKYFIGEIPVIPISKDLPQGMPQVMMPDPKNLPDGLVLSPAVERIYRNLPDMYLGNWKAFGEGQKSALPEKWVTSEITGAEAAKVANYPERVKSLGDQYEKLRAADTKVAASVQKTAEIGDAGRESVGQQVDKVSMMAKIHPLDMQTLSEILKDGWLGENFQPNGDKAVAENHYVMSLTEAALHNAEQVMSQTASQLEQLATDVKPPTEEDPAKPPPEVVKPGVDPTGVTPPPPGTQPPGVVQPPGGDLSTPDPWEWDGKGSDEKPGASTDPTNGADPFAPVKTPTSAAPPQNPAATTAPTAPMGAGIDSALQQMATQQALQAAMGNRAPADNRKAESDKKSSRDKATDHAGPVPVGPVPGQPANSTSPQPSSTQPPAATPNQTSPVRSVAAPAAPPAQQNDDDYYTFPDGRTQWLSAPVRQALSAAFGNAVSTDARAAYSNTRAALPTGVPPGASVDPSQLVTGDIATWAQRSALVVVFGTSSSATLEAVVGGKLQPYTPEMRDNETDFGVFDGFFHPAGIEPTTQPPTADAPLAPTDQPAGSPVTVPA